MEDYFLLAINLICLNYLTVHINGVQKNERQVD